MLARTSTLFRSLPLLTLELLAPRLQLSTKRLDLRDYQLNEQSWSLLREELSSRGKRIGRIDWPEVTSNDLAHKEAIEALLAQHRRAYVDRPNDYIYALCSLQAYQDDGGTLPAELGWEKIEVFDHTKIDGYFGVAFRHTEQSQYIVAHRGTNPAHVAELRQDIHADVQGIIRGGITLQQISALDFATKIKQRADFEGYQFSQTGHSLGAWLAQVCAFHLTAQQLNQPATAAQEHICAVVFDSPGASDMLTTLQPDEANARVDISQLDIVRYQSAPNLINTCSRNLHEVGTMYRVHYNLPRLTRLEEYFYTTLGSPRYNANTHSISGIVEAFNPQTGRPNQLERMLKWPHTRWKEGYHPETAINQGLQGALGLLSFKLIPSFITQALATRMVDRIAPAREIGSLVQLLTDFAGDGLDKAEYNLFHTYANPNNNYQPDIRALGFEKTYRLQHEGRYEAIPFNERVLPSRHLPTYITDFLKRYEKLTTLYTNLINANDLLKLAGLPDSEREAAKALLKFHFDRQEQLVVAEDSTATTAVEFRRQVVSLLTYYPELKTLTVYKQEAILKQLARTQGDANLLNQNLDSIRADLNIQFKLNQELLNQTIALAPQARLYLYGAASSDEIRRHSLEAKQLKDQYELNQCLYQQLKALEAAQSLTNPLLANKLKALQTDVSHQAYQLELTLGLTNAMLYQKRQCFVEAEGELIKVLNTLDKALQEDKLKLDGNTFKASIYTLRGKLARASQPKDRWEATVLNDYNQALAIATLDNQAALLSSKGALLDDLGKHDEAIACHRKAYQLQKPNVEAVTLSNLAWCLYYQAIAQTPANAYLLQEALNHLEASLKQAPYLAGTWLYRGKVMQALNRNDEALDNFTQGLIEQPDYIKLLIERAKLYEAQGEQDKALEDARQAQRLLSINLAQSPDYQELKATVQQWLSAQEETIPGMKP
jgi:hypothetical protein